MLERLLKLRRMASLLDALGGEEVDVLLVLRHRLHVVVERHKLPGLRLRAWIEHKLLDAVGILPVGVDALLENAPENIPELEVVVCALVLHLLKRGKNLGCDRLLDLADHGVVLKHLAGDVERQVSGINHALREAEVLGEKHLEVVADEHVAHVKRKTVLRLRHVDVHAGLFRQEEKCLELDLSLAGEVDDLQRIGVVVREVLVELGVFLFLDILLRTLP